MTEKLPAFFKNPHSLASLPKDSPVLVALSGGADSSLLLSLLAKLRQSENFPLYAAHVNHNIRVENGEARRDELFCRSLCESLSIPIFVADVDVPTLAQKNSLSLELQAREVRYSFFADIMREKNIRILATAHNADDNLETQIFNLCRGCGIEGICGIPETRVFDQVSGGIIVRPILSAPKSEIIDTCRALGIEYVTDSTNLETDCTRNSIRNIIVPELEKLFGSPQKNASRLSRAAKEDSEYLSEEANEFLKRQDCIKLDELAKLHPSVAKRVIRLDFSKVSHVSLEAVHVESIMSLAGRSDQASVSLPDRKRAKSIKGALIFENDVPSEDPKPFSIPLNSGYNTVPNGYFSVLIGDSEGNDTYVDENENIYKLYTSVGIKNVKIEELYAESRREGDFIRHGGMRKKVKKLLCDNGIDLGDRDRLPIIRSKEETLYVPGCAIADSVRADSTNTEYVISIYKIIN